MWKRARVDIARRRKLMTESTSKSPGSGGTKEWKDPVCGMTVKADSPHKVDRSGRTYAFCSAGCKEKFQKEPSRYAA
jgi:P-type Cu+ transporter